MIQGLVVILSISLWFSFGILEDSFEYGLAVSAAIRSHPLLSAAFRSINIDRCRLPAVSSDP